MAKLQNLTVTVKSNDGKSNEAPLQLRTWTTADGMSRALRWAGGVVLVAVLMIPIPIVHFGAIPVLLFGCPLVFFVVKKVYSSGTDLMGDINCPSCGAKISLQTAAAYWPLHRTCLNCRVGLDLEQQGTAAAE